MNENGGGKPIPLTPYTEGMSYVKTRQGWFHRLLMKNSIQTH